MRGIPTPKDFVRRIRELRRRGHTINEIRSRTGKSKSIISNYIRGISVLPQYHDAWSAKRGGSKVRAQRQWMEAKDQIAKDISSVGRTEKMLIAACLYWGEGTKLDFSLSNSDPHLIRVFVACLQEFGIPKERLRVTVRIYDDIDRQTAIDYWANVLDIAPSDIRNVNILTGKKNGKLPHGMCRIRVSKGAFPLKMLKSIQQAITLKV